MSYAVSDRTMARQGFKIQFQLNVKDLKAIAAMAEKLPKAMRKKIVRKGLRDWGKALIQRMKKRLPRAAKRTRRDLAMKTKTYKRGRIWAGVGVRVDGNRVGYRSHLYDGGYRPFAKGSRASLNLKKPGKWKGNPNPKPPSRTNRGWRDGLRRRNLGPVINRKLWLTAPAKYYATRTRQYIEDAIAESLRETTRGR